MARSAHLVGSLPGGDADDAMRLAMTTLGSSLRTLPDGETGERHNWIIHIIEAMRSHPDLEVKKDGDWSDYDKTPVFRVRRGHTLRADSLDFGHVKTFEENWPAFARLRTEQGRPNLAFQVGVPGDFDMALFTLGPVGAFRHRAVFRQATLREIREIYRRAGNDVVFQIEIPAELAFVARMPAPARPLMAASMARGVARLVELSPAGARFGVHLCLGDMNHRALALMPDTTPVVLLANAMIRAWPAGRDLEFVHAPFAAAEKMPRTDPAWYAPLVRLKLPDFDAIRGRLRPRGPGSRGTARFARPDRAKCWPRCRRLDLVRARPTDSSGRRGGARADGSAHHRLTKRVKPVRPRVILPR